MTRDLFTDDPDEEEDVRPVDNRCTPEKLLVFIRDTQARSKRYPTLAECKQQFGGILGPILDLMELKQRGDV